MFRIVCLVTLAAAIAVPAFLGLIAEGQVASEPVRYEHLSTRRIDLTAGRARTMLDGARIVLWQDGAAGDIQACFSGGRPLVGLRWGTCELGAALYVDEQGEGCLLLRTADGRTVRIRASNLTDQTLRRYETLPAIVPPRRAQTAAPNDVPDPPEAPK